MSIVSPHLITSHSSRNAGIAFVGEPAGAAIHCSISLSNWLAAYMPTSIRNAIMPTSHFGLDGDTRGKLNREKEYNAGRFCTTLLLNHWKQSGIVGTAEDRSPIWPTGFCGSISHSRNWVWAAMAKSDSICSIRSIGIDTEIVVNAQTRNELRNDIGTALEWSRMSSLQLDPETTFTILFSAKEAFYKCMYPRIKRCFDFQDVALESVHPGRLAIRCANPKVFEQQSIVLEIQYFVEANNVFTATWLTEK